MKKRTFTFRLGPETKKIKFVGSYNTNPSNMPPSAMKRSDRPIRHVSFAHQFLLNYYVMDQEGDDPEWFTKCDAFQSMSLSKTHGLTESFTLEGRELWGKLNHSVDCKKVEWSESLREKITELEMLDRDNVRVGLEKKLADERIANLETMARIEEIRQAKAAQERAAQERAAQTRAAQERAAQKRADQERAAQELRAQTVKLANGNGRPKNSGAITKLRLR